MTGEALPLEIKGLDRAVLARDRSLPQPGDREPAPGDLVLLQSFLNTHFDLVNDWGADLIDTPPRLLAWFGARGLLGRRRDRVTRSQVEDVHAFRDGLRELARMNGDADFRPRSSALAGINRVADRAPLAIHIGPERLALAPQTGRAVDNALGVLLAIATHAMIDGRWSRLKVCPGDHCGWVFYDHSRNGSGRWCSMAVCGGRTKARAHYHRRRGVRG
jgi:predicted RNA-binding Zn ribbon-like protein